MDFNKLVLASVCLQYVYLEVRSLDMRFQDQKPSGKKPENPTTIESVTFGRGCASPNAPTFFMWGCNVARHGSGFPRLRR